MRKLQITCLYIMLLLTVFFIPKPKSLLEMETYESKMRNIEQIGDEQIESIVITTQTRDSFSFLQPIP